MTTTTQDVTNLFTFAREWYLTYGNQPIPEQEWDSAKNSFNDDVEWSIHNGDASCKGTGLDFLPVLAAISAGQTGTDLLNVCRHHNLQPYSLHEFKISEAGTSDHLAVFGPHFEVPLKNLKICHEIIQAISLSDSMVSEFSGDLGFRNRREFRFACLLSDRQEFWPVTALKAVYESPYEERHETCFATDIYTFLKNGVDLAAYSNEQILKMLERSGNLVAPFEVENGLPNTFFKDLFSFLHSLREGSSHQNLLRLVEVVNSIEEPEAIEHISSLIIGSLAGPVYEIGLGGALIVKTMYQTLDPVKFAKVLENSLFLACSVSSTELTIMQMTSPQHFNPDHYKGILTNPGFRLANLLNDLATLEPQQYRDPHFRAMARLVSALNDDQSLDDLDLNEVVLKTIEGLEAYKEAIHVDVLGQETNEFKVSAVERVNEFISYLAKHMEIDYTRFANVKPETRVLLASSGFEVKKIPNMTRRERGEIIGNQLGL